MNPQARKRSRRTPTSGADDPYPTHDTSPIKQVVTSCGRSGCAGATAAYSAARTGANAIQERVPFPERTLPSSFLLRSSAASRVSKRSRAHRLHPGILDSGRAANRVTRADSSNSASTLHRTRTVRAPLLHARFWRATVVPAPPRCITTPAGRDRSPDVRSNPTRVRRAGFTYT